MRLIWIYTLAFCLIEQTLWSQNFYMLDKTSFEQAIQEVVLLKNENNILPLQDLEKCRTGFIPLAVDVQGLLHKTLKKYTDVDLLHPMAPTGGHNLLIVGIGSPVVMESFGTWLQEVGSRQNTIVVLMGLETAKSALPYLSAAKAVLFAPTLGEVFASIAPQIIFGGIGAQGTLKVDLGQTYPAGSGLQSKGDIRLRYSPASMVGLNARLMLDSIDAVVNEGIARKAYPGAQVLVAKNGHVVFHKTYGYHTYDSLEAVKEEDIYDFASVTKVSSGLPALMKLYGEGKIDLDAALEKIYPYFKGSDKGDLTLRGVLTHTARLRAWIPFWRSTLRFNSDYPWLQGWNADKDSDGNFKSKTFFNDSTRAYRVKVTDDLWLHKSYKKKILKAIKISPLNEKPGYVYSDLSFYLYPEILPKYTGLAFEPYLKQEFYHPLGATTLTYNAADHFPLSRIIPTERDTFFRKGLIHGRVHDEGAAMLSGISGHAGLFGSANDLAKLFQLYLNLGQYGGKRYIQESALLEFIRCQYCDKGINRGLGFDKPLVKYDPVLSSVAKDASPNSFGHSGYTGTFVWADPDEQLLFIFFSNRVYPTRDNRRLYSLNIRPRIHQVLYEAGK